MRKRNKTALRNSFGITHTVDVPKGYRPTEGRYAQADRQYPRLVEVRKD